jgi:hypothetical protein
VEVSLPDCSVGWLQKAMIWHYHWISRISGPDTEQIATSPSNSLGNTLWDGVRFAFMASLSYLKCLIASLANIAELNGRKDGALLEGVSMILLFIHCN